MGGVSENSRELKGLLAPQRSLSKLGRSNSAQSDHIERERERAREREREKETNTIVVKHSALRPDCCYLVAGPARRGGP